MEILNNILTFILCLMMGVIIACTGQKELVDHYDYFTVDSVRSDGLYEILIKDPDSRFEPMLFPTGGSIIIPETYERFIKIIYKSDSVWISGDTLILQKK